VLDPVLDVDELPASIFATSSSRPPIQRRSHG
jgi:hypothetical protein